MVKHAQTIRRLLPTNCLSVFDHFVGLGLKGLTCHNDWPEMNQFFCNVPNVSVYLILKHFKCVKSKFRNSSFPVIIFNLHLSLKKSYNQVFWSKAHSNLDILQSNHLTRFCPMFPFYNIPYENIRKPLVFWCFQGV